jgi:hypothetical protein
VTKGIDTLRASRASDTARDALLQVDAARTALGIKLPDAWATSMGPYACEIQFSGIAGLKLRCDPGGAWALWFAGTLVNVFSTAAMALAEAKKRGWLKP